MGVADDGTRITRRALLAAGAVAGAGLAAGVRPATAAQVVRRVDFSALEDGEGWPAGWCSPGTANLRVNGGRGILEAGSDVFPNDPRPAVFAVDTRVRDVVIRAVVTTPGSLVGVVARRTGPQEHYAAFYDSQLALLSIVRRSGTDLVTLALLPVPAADELTLELAASGASPTQLTATLTPAGGLPIRLTAHDDHRPLQAPGDSGVLGQARTLFPSAGPPVLPSLGNVHLLPYGVQEGEAFLQSPAGQQIIAEIRRESTVAFREIAVSSTEIAKPTPASIIAATTGLPRTMGARLHVATDLPADVVIEVAETAAFDRPRRIAHGRTGKFEAFTINAHGLAAGTLAHWRPTLHRAGVTTVGPVRSFPVLPAAGDGAPVRLAIAACAAQFGPLFDDLMTLGSDVLVWQGDLNYPDTQGPLAQTMTCYAGIWRDFLANPRLLPVLQRSAFVAVRDDHDYAAQDSNQAMISKLPWGVEPWDALMGEGHGYHFAAGVADVWVLDQRRFKSDPAVPDGPDKSLLGERQRAWLVETLRASTAPFKVICSPCTVFIGGNGRDGNWSNGFRAERDGLLRHIDREVSGRVIFVTGDTHLTGVYDQGGRYEARPCPLGIPAPNDITISDPFAADTLRAKPGVTYADDRCHYAVLDIHGDGDTATLELSLRRDDGTTPYRKTFTQSVASPTLNVRIGRVDDRHLSTSVTFDRPGLIRLRATVRRLGDGRQALTRIADRVVRIPRAGQRQFRLPMSRSGRAALRLPGRRRLTLTARYRSPAGRVTLRRVRRLLRRSQ